MFTDVPDDVKVMWIDALRSGDYDQCEGQLHTRILTHEGYSEYFCAVGVLLDQSGCKDITNIHVTDKQLKKARITREDAEKVMRMNDCEGFTFEEIACKLLK